MLCGALRHQHPLWLEVQHDVVALRRWGQLSIDGTSDRVDALRVLGVPGRPKGITAVKNRQEWSLERQQTCNAGLTRPTGGCHTAEGQAGDGQLVGSFRPDGGCSCTSYLAKMPHVACQFGRLSRGVHVGPAECCSM